MNWLLFMPQVPASPSSLRVTVWRRLKAAGALGLQNGVWVLPLSSGGKQFLDDQMTYIERQGGTSVGFEVVSLTPSVEETIITGFKTERNEEYTEFRERCDVLLAELKKETTGEKFTFAELEETEADLHKLETWLTKIAARDFFGSTLKEDAFERMQACRVAYDAFAAHVYTQHGISSSDAPELEELGE